MAVAETPHRRGSRHDAREAVIRGRLLERGQALLRAPRTPSRFTKIPEADRLLNDLEGCPHAFVLGCVVDRQIKAEKAWAIPYRLQQKLETFAFADLRKVSEARWRRLMSKPEPLHRFPQDMARYLYLAIRRIDRQYGGRASLIWGGKPSSAEVVYRFLEFEGIGQKIATMAANILARQFKIEFSDYSSIDISVDSHVKRVFERLGLVRADTTPLKLAYRARALHPKFPGLLDYPAFEIGRSWCRKTNPLCEDCYMSDLCPAAVQGG